ncbi:FAD/NAD(P)-binding protein [Pseudoxanthomonas sp. UTMC 1351]|uniref:FAD/NAD(P)-binding protein n=1 Tax=Pseudoxanthomonas sp. UTMC 1351 TaxID=2695853 RepID=UPI0034CE22D4
MTSTQNEDIFDLAIIGGGAAGVLATIHALRVARTAVRIVLIEPAERLGEGVAYATRYREHLLNVPIRRMSAFDDAPADFLDYMMDVSDDGADRQTLAHQYAERRQYGHYLRDRLERARAASSATLQILRGRMIGLVETGDVFHLDLQDGESLSAQTVLLAVGNASKPLPARGAGALPAGAVIPAWDFDAVKAIPVNASVCIVGSGLSMVDSALSLADNGHRGNIHVLSRHTLLPLSHSKHAVADFDTQQLLAMNLRQRMRFLRAAARDAAVQGLPWQAVMERIRPLGQTLWQSLSVADQRRFLRHVVRLWDVHRHRIAPQVHARIKELQISGQLEQHRGRLDAVMPIGACVRLVLRQHDGRDQPLDVDRIINATGVEMRAQTMRNPLLLELLGSGHAQAGPHGIGLRTDRDGALLNAQGQPQPRLMVIGSLRIGCLWESIAVPELRGQAEAAARQLLSRSLVLSAGTAAAR